MPVWRQFSGWNLSVFLTEKNAIGCHECKQKGNARKTARSITSKKEMLKRRRVQLRANVKCSKEGPPNCEQKEFARRRTRPIAILNNRRMRIIRPPLQCLSFPDRTTQQHIQV